MNKEEKKALKAMDRFANSEDLSVVTAKEMRIILNLISRTQKENERNLIVREEIKQIADNLYYNNYKGNFADGEFAREMAIKLKEILEREE